MLIHLAHLAAGMFLLNSLPHLLSGVSGRPFPTPFANPPGKGLSSPVVNVFWAAFNVATGTLLITQTGAGALVTPADALICAAGALLTALGLAVHFGSVFRSQPAPR